ncbi:hypothetical protein CAEBREN_29856 [Caenorhabditis brenneri]|uniref:Uncharacterized protein n=1 Tax=Caenorhabditis brenneri TaxID=135651 RepID=G0MKU6_CAEBE|nr:hypothetical protein CAEBREN_29856 [Caenorhabditis brenneri]
MTVSFRFSSSYSDFPKSFENHWNVIRKTKSDYEMRSSQEQQVINKQPVDDSKYNCVFVNEDDGFRLNWLKDGTDETGGILEEEDRKKREEKEEVISCVNCNIRNEKMNTKLSQLHLFLTSHSSDELLDESISGEF